MSKRLDSLTPDEREDVTALLALLSARCDLSDPGANHTTLEVSSKMKANALRVPLTATVDELIGWAQLLREP